MRKKVDPLQSEDIANAVLFFASDRANWVTGSKLIADGGELAIFPPVTGG